MCILWLLDNLLIVLGQSILIHELVLWIPGCCSAFTVFSLLFHCMCKCASLDYSSINPWIGNPNHSLNSSSCLVSWPNWEIPSSGATTISGLPEQGKISPCEIRKKEQWKGNEHTATARIHSHGTIELNSRVFTELKHILILYDMPSRLLTYSSSQ